MKKFFLLILISLNTLLSCSQNENSPYPNFIGQNLTAIEINTKWKILTKAIGDLNKDSTIDLTLILESKDSILEKRCSECKTLKTKPRIILVLLNENGNQKVIIQNNKFISRGEDGGMLTNLEPELSIENQLLTIYYQYIRSNQSYTFELKKSRMKIVSAESNGVYSANGDFENIKFDLVKREITTTTGNISQEKVKTEVLKINVKPKYLSEFNEMYEWEITENKYL